MRILLALIIVLITTAANAQDRFYLGIETQSSTLSLKDGSIETSNGTFILQADDYYDNKLNSFVPFIGVRINEVAAVELSYFSDDSFSFNNATGLVWSTGPLSGQKINVETRTSLKVYGLDTVYNLKLKDLPLRFLGIAGVSYIDFDVKESYNDGNSKQDNPRGLGINLGVGFELDLYKNVSIITKAKYIQTLNVDVKNMYSTRGLDNITNLSTGIKFKF
jgi:hypothetical protein